MVNLIGPDKGIPPPKVNEIRMFLVVRNEALRLPYILNYYRKLKIDRIIAIDNGSTDNTAAIIKEQPNSHVFFTRDNFKDYGSWVRDLLDQYGRDCWSLVVDADEILIYPYIDKICLPELCEFLDMYSYEALHCLLLDMYPKESLSDIKYITGEDPLEYASFFDPSSHNSPRVRYYGGMRQRVFGINPCLSKFPLIRFGDNNVPADGMHSVTTQRIADIQGSLLHTKYLQDFLVRVTQEAKREQHWNNAIEYKAYASLVRTNSDFSIYFSDSVKYKNWVQLLKKNILKSSANFKKFIQNIESNL